MKNYRENEIKHRITDRTLITSLPFVRGIAVFAAVTASWFVMAAQPEPQNRDRFDLTINFKPADSNIDTGMDRTTVEDNGNVFGNRGNGYAFGWNADNRAAMRERSCDFDILDVSLARMQTDGGGSSWEIALPNAEYLVEISAGDCSFETNRYRIDAEGIRVIDNKDASLFPFTRGNAKVTVTDGKLTLTNGAGAINNKITSIKITQL